MPPNRERARLVREDVKAVLEAEAARAHITEAEIEPAVRTHCLAEALALFIAEIRADGGDEDYLTEVLLRSVDLDRETLLEARGTMRALGYDVVADVLRRVARSAPGRVRRLKTFAPSHRKQTL